MENGATVLYDVRVSPVQFDSDTKIDGISQCNRVFNWEKIILLWLFFLGCIIIKTSSLFL